jgi:predicted Co/Zn/Cd cation transporter (cation efflux family)
MPTCAGLPAAAFIDACPLAVWQTAPRQFEPSFLCVTERKDSAMLGFAAAVIFFIAFLINATSTATSAVFSPMSLLLVGLICLALHLSGVGTGWAIPGRRTRR